MSTYKFNENYKERKDLFNRYGDNARLLYALELRFGREDIHSDAAEALTDGGDDQKCDLLFINEDGGYAVIAQASEKKMKVAGDLAPSGELAPENKAIDLNAAIAWVFGKSTAGFIPTALKNAIIKLNDEIESDNIGHIYLWYVHNFDEVRNPKVAVQMEKARETAVNYIKTKYPEKQVGVECIEVGVRQLEKWYSNSSKRIIIKDELELKVPSGFELNGQNGLWSAFVTAVDGSWLKDLYIKYEDDLFSGNPRNYLGSHAKKLIINSGIKRTIENDSDNFWPFNNGVTALVESFSYNEKKKIVSIKGITIINGAQTTGAIASAGSSKSFLVPIRFITCKKEGIIASIVSNNNKQNEILTSDARSNDLIQQGLRDSFKKYPQLHYNGGRRSENALSKDILQFDHYLVGQLLYAFHFDAYTAYNKKKYIWLEDNLYNPIFKDSLKTEHIVFLYSLSKAIDDYKFTLKTKGKDRTNEENNIYNFLRERGAKMLFVSAVSKFIEEVLGKRIIDKFKLQFKTNTHFAKCVENWTDLLISTIIYYDDLQEGLNDGLKNKENIEKALKNNTKAIYRAKTKSKKFAEKFVKSVEG